MRLSERTLERLRVSGLGPKFIRCGRRSIRYRQSDLEGWPTARSVRSTSEQAGEVGAVFMTEKDSALSFVGQINKAYEAAEKAGASALSAALECGYYLNLAFENVEAAKGKGKWNQWRKANLDKSAQKKLKDFIEGSQRLLRKRKTSLQSAKASAMR